MKKKEKGKKIRSVKYLFRSNKTRDIIRKFAYTGIETFRRKLEFTLSKLDNDQMADKKVSPRKRSIFSTSFPFRFGTLRRTSSEQVLTINEMMDKKLAKSTEISVSTSDINKTGTHNMAAIREDYNQNQTPVRPLRISQEKLQGNSFFSKNSQRLVKKKEKLSNKIFSYAGEKVNSSENGNSIKEQQDESNVENIPCPHQNNQLDQLNNHIQYISVDH